MPMGCSSSCKTFEMLSSAVEWIAQTKLHIPFITWDSQRETKFKNALHYFCCCCFLPSVTNCRLAPKTHAPLLIASAHAHD